MRTLFLKERAKRFIAAFVVFAAFFCICFLHRVYAKDADTETVRVGYYENEVFQEGAGEGTVFTVTLTLKNCEPHKNPEDSMEKRKAVLDGMNARLSKP